MATKAANPPIQEVTDFSSMTVDQIQELLARRRAELAEVQVVAKEKGITVPRQPKVDTPPEDQLRAGIQRLARGQWRVDDESARRDRAQDAYDQLVEQHYPEGLPTELQAELQGLYDATLEKQVQMEQARQANKKAKPAPAENGAAPE